MKKYIRTAVAAVALLFSGGYLGSAPVVAPSTITSVKLFTNKAEIKRVSRIRLEKGLNTIRIDGLPDSMYDWSARGSLPEKYNGKILSMEISRHALLEKRTNRILEIEKKLEELKETDSGLADDLANIAHQETFLNSVNEFTKNMASKELETRLPQTGVWSSTLDFTNIKRKELLNSKRVIVKKRRRLAEEIQKWEFELSQIAGHSYFSSYQTLNKAIETNTSSNMVQQYSEVTDQYAARRKYLTSDTSRLDTEKRILVNIFSATSGETDFTFSYLIPDTYWMMKYDFRASKKNDDIEVILYSDIYQKTGEDWDNIDLSLSTGAPLNSIALPGLDPWYLSGYEPKKDGYNYPASKAKRAYKKSETVEGAAGMSDFSMDEEKPVPETTVKQSGLYMEVAFPIKQTIESSGKYQKKFLKSYRIKGNSGLKFYYQTIPASTGRVFLMAKAVNRTELPWLGGEAQVFLENEFIGKVDIPETPLSKEQNLVLGIIPDMVSKKELVKRYDDTSGVFGGKKKIVYSYKITVENNSDETREALILDNFPVSGSGEIEVEIKNLSLNFQADDETKKTTEYGQGIRRFNVTMSPGTKKEITYDAVITYDRDFIINGLK